MRIANLLQEQFVGDLVGIHLARVRVVVAAACALLRGETASLTGIGRAIALGTSHKHGIKRVDRLLGNEQVWAERIQFYKAMARRLIGREKRPVVIVDWTSFSGEFWVLAAALSFEGRALVIYSEAHPIARYMKPDVHRAFLLRLRQVLPEGCVPVIVTDAGFRTPWMRQVLSLGWDYIGRLRGRNRLREARKGEWSNMLEFFARVGCRAKDFGECEISKRTLFRTRVIGFAKRSRRRAQWSEYWGTIGKSDTAKAIRSAREPWILATSLTFSAQKVVALYGRRMQIEETFRDTKSSRFGFMMEHAHTKSEKRADNLMLVASLAHLFSVLAGTIAEAAGLDRGFQANTRRAKRVFSLSRLGRLFVNSEDRHVPMRAIRSAWRQLRERICFSGQLCVVRG